MDYPQPQARYSPIGLTRTPTPMPPSILKNGAGGQRQPSSLSPKRQRSASFKSMLVDECDDVRTVATVPDNISDTASEASSNGSYNNQPPLLDFVGSMCVASAWFTSCFPCAVVDINDTDDRVVHNLSRESAMSMMYSNKNYDSLFERNNRNVTTPECGPFSDGKQVSGSSAIVGRDSNAMYTQQLNERGKSESKIICIPSIIEEDSDDEDTMEVVPLQQSGPANSMLKVECHERLDSGIIDHRGIAAGSECRPYSQPKTKMRFGMKNPFGRKKIIKC